MEHMGSARLQSLLMCENMTASMLQTGKIRDILELLMNVPDKSKINEPLKPGREKVEFEIRS